MFLLQLLFEEDDTSFTKSKGFKFEVYAYLEQFEVFCIVLLLALIGSVLLWLLVLLPLTFRNSILCVRETATLLLVLAG